MKPQSPLVAVALMLASIGLILQQSVHADTFGSRDTSAVAKVRKNERFRTPKKLR